MRTPIRTLVTALAAAFLAAACAGTASSPTSVATQAPTSTPSQTNATAAAPSATPAPTPIPTTDGVGPEYVATTGSSSLVVSKAGTETVVGDVTQLRGQEMTSTATMNDPRVSGSALITLDADIHDTVAAEWGTTRIENADGAWQGTWTGISWNAGSATTVSGWLTGSGAYAGWTYYFHTFGLSEPFQTEGIIFKGAAPAP